MSEYTIGYPAGVTIVALAALGAVVVAWNTLKLFVDIEIYERHSPPAAWGRLATIGRAVRRCIAVALACGGGYHFFVTTFRRDLPAEVAIIFVCAWLAVAATDLPVQRSRP